MLNSSKKQKGKRLEKFVAGELAKVFSYAYSRADSGSGKFAKEDVTLPKGIPLFIECKNQADLELMTWWRQTLEGCPASKYPVLIYRLNFQKVPTVYLRFGDLLSMMSGKKVDTFQFNISLSFDDFLQVLKEIWIKTKRFQ
jgi:hypothetical protein